jgi:hypothetical protein
MNGEEIATVYRALKRNKLIFSKSVNWRRRGKGEVEAAEVLKRSAGRIGELENFLRPMGMSLEIYESQSLGLPGSCIIYVGIQNPQEMDFFKSQGNKLIHSIQNSLREDTIKQATIWATFLALISLNILYTRQHRPIDAVSGFRDSAIDADEILEELRDRIEVMRNSGTPEATRSKEIYEALTSGTEKKMESRVRSFLRALVEVDVLERLDNVGSNEHPVFRQTLWSAVDIARNFRRYAPHLHGTSPIENVEELSAGLPATTVSESEEYNVHD